MSFLLLQLVLIRHCIRHTVFINNQHVIQRRGQDFDSKFVYLKEYTAKRLTDEFRRRVISYTAICLHLLPNLLNI